MDPLFTRGLVTLICSLIGLLVGGWLTWRRQVRSERIQRAVSLVEQYNTDPIVALRNKIWSKADVLMGGGQNLQQVYESMASDKPLVEPELFYEYLTIQNFFRKVALLIEQNHVDKKLVRRVFTKLLGEWWDKLFEPFSAGMDDNFHEQRVIGDIRKLLNTLR